MISPDVSGAAFRLVRAAHEHRLAGETVPEGDLPAILSVVATMAAGLLEDLAYASGDSPEGLLDILETRSMERLLT